MAQHRSLGILPRGLDKRAHLSESEGDQDKTVPALSSRLTANKLPLSPGEGWGEGNSHYSAHPTAHLKRQLLTN